MVYIRWTNHFWPIWFNIKKPEVSFSLGSKALAKRGNMFSETIVVRACFRMFYHTRRIKWFLPQFLSPRSKIHVCFRYTAKTFRASARHLEISYFAIVLDFSALFDFFEHVQFEHILPSDFRHSSTFLHFYYIPTEVKPFTWQIGRHQRNSEKLDTLWVSTSLLRITEVEVLTQGLRY